MTGASGRVATLAVAMSVIGGAAGFWLASHQDLFHTVPPPTTAREERKILYWFDPMVPNQHFDKPGKSPFMDMALVPSYSDGDGTSASIKLDPRVTQNLGVRLAAVERGTLLTPITAVATVRWNERSVALVQARSAGFVERVYARAPEDSIAKGAPLVDLLVPDWTGTQTEFLAMLSTGDVSLAQAARNRMRLAGMPSALIAQVESSRQVKSVVTIFSPIGGVIRTLDVRIGMSIPAGAPIAKINASDPAWLEASIPEAQAEYVAAGDQIDASLLAYPQQHLTGKIIAVLPETSPENRTVRVRAELPNRDGKLKVGMFARINLDASLATPVLQIPSEAVIRTGTRAIVLIALGAGHFQPMEVKLGREAHDKVMVIEGLNEGQRIVVSGQFLIDSEANIRGVLARLTSAPATEPAAAVSSASVALPAPHGAEGKVDSIKDGEVVLSHGPVPSMGWGPMTMPFRLARADMVAAIKVGDSVKFRFRQGDDGYVIEELSKTSPAP